jgi:predicted nucleic acid-binding protein
MGEGVLVDTDVLIDYVKGTTDLPKEQLFITEITLYEFVRGTKDVSKAKKLLEEGFSVVFHNNSIIQKASEIWVEVKGRGEILDDRDILIGAVSAVKDLPLHTRNRRHYEGLEEFGVTFYG